MKRTSENYLNGDCDANCNNNNCGDTCLLKSVGANDINANIGANVLADNICTSKVSANSNLVIDYPIKQPVKLTEKLTEKYIKQTIDQILQPNESVKPSSKQPVKSTTKPLTEQEQYKHLSIYFNKQYAMLTKKITETSHARESLLFRSHLTFIMNQVKAGCPTTLAEMLSATNCLIVSESLDALVTKSYIGLPHSLPEKHLMGQVRKAIGSIDPEYIDGVVKGGDYNGVDGNSNSINISQQNPTFIYECDDIRRSDNCEYNQRCGRICQHSDFIVGFYSTDPVEFECYFESIFEENKKILCQSFKLPADKLVYIIDNHILPMVLGLGLSNIRIHCDNHCDYARIKCVKALIVDKTVQKIYSSALSHMNNIWNGDTAGSIKFDSDHFYNCTYTLYNGASKLSEPSTTVCSKECPCYVDGDIINKSCDIKRATFDEELF